MHKSLHRAGLIVLYVAAASVAEAASPFTYRIVPVLPPAGFPAGVTSTFAVAINNHGQVLGDAELSGHGRRSRSFIWRGGTMRMLPLLPGDDTSNAVAVNDGGDAVGYSYRASAGAQFHAVLWRGGRALLLPPPAPYRYAVPRSIDVNGSVLLSVYNRPGQPERKAVWKDGHTRLLPARLTGSEILAGNTFYGTSGHVIGNGFTAALSGPQTPLLPGTLKLDPTAAASGGICAGMALQPRVGPLGRRPHRISTGSYKAPERHHPFSWPFLSTGGKIVLLPTPPSGDFVAANAVNRRGEVVGSYVPASSFGQPVETRAVICSVHRAADLNNCIPFGSGWTLITATGTNDSGSIVGYGTHYGKREGFLLIPM